MSLRAENSVVVAEAEIKTRVGSVHSRCCVWKESRVSFHNKLTDTRYASGFCVPRKKNSGKLSTLFLTQKLDREITVGRSLLMISKNSGR